MNFLCVYMTIMESGHQDHNKDGGMLLGPSSTLVVHMDPMGNRETDTKTDVESHVHVSERVP